VIVPHVEHCGLGCSGRAELILFIDAAGLGLIFFALASALGLVPLLLLSCLFFLTLRKRLSASWHNLSPNCCRSSNDATD